MLREPVPIVIDASVAAKWQLPDEDHYLAADALRREIERGKFYVVVPEFWRYEIASIYSKAVANRRVADHHGETAIEIALAVPQAFVPFPEPLEAFRAARRFNRTLIDCFYLRIAEEQGCDFWTDDRKLVRTLSDRYPFVRWIGDYPAPAHESSETP